MPFNANAVSMASPFECLRRFYGFAVSRCAVSVAKAVLRFAV